MCPKIDVMKRECKKLEVARDLNKVLKSCKVATGISVTSHSHVAAGNRNFSVDVTAFVHPRQVRYKCVRCCSSDAGLTVTAGYPSGRSGKI
jgi:hypothetical protein